MTWDWILSSNKSLKNKLTNKIFPYRSYIWKQDLALNNPQGLIYHESPKKLNIYVQIVCLQIVYTIKKIQHLIALKGWYAMKQ